MTSARNPTAGFWITVALVAVLVGYPLSIGPTEWIFLKLGGPTWLGTAMGRAYAPLD
jgi:hypothetical protein